MGNAEVIYKICARSEWQAARAQGRYTGSPDDARDGFIHFSTRAQVADTAAKHFRDRHDLLLVAVDARQLGASLLWEPSRGGALFPHLYAPLAMTAVINERELTTNADGLPEIPGDLA